MEYRLLIVDDELSTRRLLAYLLEPHYDVFCAKDGQEAKAWLDEGNTVNLIITDIQMPVMGGLEFIGLLSKDKKYSRIPVVVVSSQTEEYINGRLQKPLAHALLNKPIEPKALFWRIEQLLARTAIL